MKLAQDNNRVFNSLGDVVNPQYQDIVWVNNNAYIYLPNEGGWKLDTHIPYNYFISLVPNDYDFQANNKTDVSTAENWDKYGKYFTDYLFYRDAINIILITKANPNSPTIDFSGWGTLTSSEQEIMSRYVLCPYALRLTVFTEAEDKENWKSLVQITQGLESPSTPFTGRALVVEKMRGLIADKVRVEQMTMATSQQFFKDVFELTEWYMRAACPDFKLWLTNEVGSPYENDGFEQKVYWSQQLEDELMDIYNGEA